MAIGKDSPAHTAFHLCGTTSIGTTDRNTTDLIKKSLAYFDPFTERMLGTN